MLMKGEREGGSYRAEHKILDMGRYTCYHRVRISMHTEGMHYVSPPLPIVGCRLPDDGTGVMTVKHLLLND